MLQKTSHSGVAASPFGCVGRGWVYSPESVPDPVRPGHSDGVAETESLSRCSRSIARVEEVEGRLEGVQHNASDVGLKEVDDSGKIHGQEFSLRNPPLPIVDGLNPSRVRVDADAKAADIVRRLIVSQQHHDPTDGEGALRERFATGNVALDSGERLSPDSTVRAGDFIWFYRRPAPERHIPGELTELYRDERLLVVDKPPFMSTLPRGQHITETAVVRARRQFGINELSPAHRLDRLTRGVLLFTTSQEVRGRYQRMFEQRLVVKEYEAVTEIPDGWDAALSATAAGTDDIQLPVPAGALSAESPDSMLPPPSREEPWVLRHHMVKLRGRMATYLTEAEPNSETRVVALRVITRKEDGDDVRRLVWRLQPHSGRTHQLRVNLRLFGTPIIDDPLYGVLTDEALWDVDEPMPFVPAVADEDFSTPMNLTAARMSFTDPFSREQHDFRTGYGPGNYRGE